MKVNDVKTKALLILVFMQFVAIVVVNFTKSYGFLEFDSSLAIRHALEMWENGLFLKDYNYFSTMEIDNAAFWAAPIYAATGNLSLALGCVHILLYAGVIIILHDIFDNIDLPMENYLLAILLLFTPYTTGQVEYANMFFISVGQYEFRIIVVLLLLDLMIMCDMGLYKSQKFIIVTAIYTIISFWTALSTGNYVLFMLVSPFILKLFLDALRQEKFVLKSTVNVIILISICSGLVGWGLHNFFMGNSFRNDLTLISAGEFFANILNCITGIFLLFGGVNRGGGFSVFSLAGIHILLRFFFITGCLFLIGQEIICHKRNKNIMFYFVPFAFVNLSVLFITHTQYGSLVFEERYHILWCVLLLLSLAFIVTDQGYYKNIWIRNSVVYGLVLLLVAINVLGFYGLSKVDNKRLYEMSVINTAKKLHVDTIYLYDDIITAHIVRAIAPSLYCISISSADDMYYMDVGNMYKYYGDNANAGEKNILICKSEEMETFPEYLKKSYQMMGAFGQRNLYYSNRNPWDDISGLPLESIDYSVDYPYSPGFEYKGVINENGQLVLNESEQDGYVFWGPYTETVEGAYEMQLDYEIVKEGDSAVYIDIVVDGGTSTLSRKNLQTGSNVLVLENIEIPSKKVLELRIWKPADAVVNINKISYLRKQ